MKQIAWITAAAVATAIVLVGLWQYMTVVVLFLVSLMLAAVVRPFVEKLTDRGIPKSAAIGLTFAAGTLGILVILYFAVSLAIVDFQHVIRDLGVSYDYIHAHWPHGNALEQAIARRFPPLEKFPESLAAVPPSVLLENLLGVSRSVFDMAVNVLVIVVLSMYWSVDYHRFERLWMSLLPVDERVRAREMWRSIEHEVGVYLRSEILQSLVAGVVLGLILTLARFPYPIAVSVLAALAWLVPWIGPALAITTIWFAALLDFPETTATVTITRAVLASALTLLVYSALEFLLEPRLIDRDRYSSLLIALVAMAMAEMVGIVGLVLGPPLAVAIQRILDHYLWQSAHDSEEMPKADVVSLADRLAELRLRIDPNHAAPLGNLFGRLSQLLEDSKPVLPLRPHAPLAPPSNHGQPQHAESSSG